MDSDADSGHLLHGALDLCRAWAEEHKHDCLLRLPPLGSGKEVNRLLCLELNAVCLAPDCETTGGTVLHGPSGVGKTTMLKALCV